MPVLQPSLSSSIDLSGLPARVSDSAGDQDHPEPVLHIPRHGKPSVNAPVRRSGYGESADLDRLAALLGVPEVVLDLLGQPAFGAATEGLRQPDRHFRRDAEAAIEQERGHCQRKLA